MGQKVHPTGFRLGVVTDWTSKWYAEKSEYVTFLQEDIQVKEFLKKKIGRAHV